jgi:hypothetical protein
VDAELEPPKGAVACEAISRIRLLDRRLLGFRERSREAAFRLDCSDVGCSLGTSMLRSRVVLRNMRIICTPSSTSNSPRSASRALGWAFAVTGCVDAGIAYWLPFTAYWLPFTVLVGAMYQYTGGVFRFVDALLG